MQQTPKLGDRILFNSANDGQIFGFVVAVHNDECVNLVAWNRGGTQITASSVLRGEGAGRWNFRPES